MQFPKKSLGSPEHRKLIALLVKARNDAGMTQQFVAERMGWPQAHISKIERGDRRIDVVEFVRLSCVIGFDPREIIVELQDIN